MFGKLNHPGSPLGQAHPAVQQPGDDTKKMRGPRHEIDRPGSNQEGQIRLSFRGRRNHNGRGFRQQGDR